MANDMLSRFGLVLLGIILVPIVFQIANEANVTGLTLTVVVLIPVLFTVGVLFEAVKGIRA